MTPLTLCIAALALSNAYTLLLATRLAWRFNRLRVSQRITDAVVWTEAERRRRDQPRGARGRFAAKGQV